MRRFDPKERSCLSQMVPSPNPPGTRKTSQDGPVRAEGVQVGEVSGYPNGRGVSGSVLGANVLLAGLTVMSEPVSVRRKSKPRSCIGVIVRGIPLRPGKKEILVSTGFRPLLG